MRKARWRVDLFLWSSLIAALLGVLVNSLVLASTAPPHDYYVLSPEPLTGPLSVMSLEPGNTISVGTYSTTLKQYESSSIPATAFTSGSKLSGTGFFTVGSNENAADLLVPDDFAGTQFVIPHIAGNHRYFFLSPAGTANVTVQIGANSYNVTANQGVVNEFDAGSDNSQAGRITSDAPIVLTHVAYVSGAARDAYPVPPAVNDVIGVRSQNTILAALNSGTTVMVYASDGSSSSHSLGAGEQLTLSLGSGTTQGQGSALHIVANAPVAAVQYDDGDGTDATAFWASTRFGRRHGLPVNTQYLAVACDQPSVTLTLYKGASAPEVQSCSGSSTTPGKAYFGANTSGANLSAGWYLISSSPVYAAYEAATPEDEHNLLGLTPVAGPTAPTLNSIASPTTSNPQSVSGTAGANQTVRLYVNGLLQATATANGSGAYTFSAALIDGTNTLYATTVTSGNESDPSNAVSVTYNNTIPRSQSGSISGAVVWTPGIPATPYVITANLTVPTGAKLTLQPGTTLKFANGTVLTATGELKISGTAAAPVVFTSNAVTPARGSWSGVLINGSAGSVVEYATIEYTLTAINVSGVPATVRNNTLRYFTNNGVYVSGAGASTTIVQGNYIDNLNDTGDCIESSGSSPTITGNTLTNCLKGVNLTGSGNTTTISGVNIVTGSDYGIYADGGGSTTPTPVVTGNQIYTNDNYNFYAVSYGSGGSTVKINATGNWWGSTSPVTISGSIRDLTDDYTSAWPTVNYTNFLDGPNGSAVTGNYLIGKLTASTVLTAGATYDIMGAVFVNSGVTLTIPAGTTIRFQVFALLIVDGTLLAQGTSGNPVTITSGRPVQAPGDWNGIYVRAGTGSIVEYANINYGSTSINATGVSAIVRNNTIGNFSANGVYVNGAGAATTIIQNNLIDNLNDTADCIEANASSPTISGNTLTNCSVGVRLFGSGNTTTITGNIITTNTYGIYADGNLSATPTPTVTGNQLFGNITSNFYTLDYATSGSTLKINATGNWWGSTSIPTISTGIHDLTDDYDSTRLPTINYAGFLDGPGGSPVAGNHLIGRFTTSTTLTAGSTYDVLGALYVNSGVTLTIPAGTTLRFPIATLLVVDGTLLTQGTSGSPVTLTSSRPIPARGDWGGIFVRSGTGSIIEYMVIEWTVNAVNISGVPAIVRDNTVRNFSTNGIYISGAGASGTVIQNNLIDNLGPVADCVETSASSPTLSGNTLTNCTVGIRLTGSGNTTTITGNIITTNTYGIYADGNLSATPTPTVTGNQLFGNITSNFYTLDYATSGSTLKINATGNWWGSTSIPTISAGIRDLTDDYDSTRLPTINYAGFLDSPTGAAVVGNYLIGKFTGSTSLTAGMTYDVLGALYVSSGATLTIPSGVTLRFPIATILVVDGTLLAQGTSGNPVTFTSGRPTPARDDWSGIYVRGGTGSIIEYALIEWVPNAVNINGVPAIVRNSTVRNFSTNGIYISGAGALGTVIQNNLVDNLAPAADCIEASASSPTITGNTLTHCTVGIRLTGSGNSATINGNNIVTGNTYGIYADGNLSANPTPTVTGNQLFGNITSNFYTLDYATSGSTLKINATGNWWGDTSIPIISNGIHDLTDDYDSTRLPTVDFSNFLDGPTGSPVVANHLIGRFTTSTTLTAGSTYDVLGVLYVNTGVTLTIPAGTILRFHQAAARLVVNGTLSIQGTAASKARLTSAKVDPARGDWYGIEITATATSVVIDHADIEWTTRAVSVTGTNATVSNSLIHNFTENGIRMTNATAGSQIVSNYIDNYDSTGTGIYLSASSPAITGNKIYRTSMGIFAIGASNPSITGNAISNNGRGIVLDGNNSNSATAVPNPVITGNDIFGNTGAQLEIYRYGATNPVVINATGNWWGTATPAAGQQILFTGGSPVSKADFSNPSTASQTGPVGGNVILSEYYFSPNNDAVKDATTISGTLNQSASWTVTIRNSNYSTVRSFSGSGTTISAIWDGRDGGGSLLPDAIYTIQVEASGGSGSSIIGARVATLDTTAPATAITTPAGSAVLSNVLQIPVLGSASDGYLVNFTLDYGTGASPATWTTLTSQAASVSAGTLGTWVVSSAVGGAVLGSGPYVLRLRTSDKAGNTGLLQVPVTLELMSITGVTHNTLRVIQPLLGEQFQVNFTLPAAATASLRIYPETGGALVKEITQVFGSGGAKSLSWDGRNSAGAYVPEEAYSYVLYADDGVRNAIYDPPAPGGDGSGSGTVDSSFNATKNDFWKMNYTMSHYGRIRMQVSGCTSPTHFPYNWAPYPPGTHPLIWDGRGADGQIVSGTCAIYFDPPLYMKSNSVIVRGTTPKVSGTGASPGIEVKSNPYRITHSYEHISKITYRVDQDSYVTVKLLPPGVSDPASPQAIVITNNVLTYAQSGGQPADHVVEWKGYEDLDTNNILVSEEGSYTFAIQATGVTTGRTALYRGALQLWQ